MTVETLDKVAWIGSTLKFCKNKRRLLLEYFLIGLIVSAAALAFSTWLSKERTEKSLLTTRSELEAVQQRLGSVESVNQQQESTIDQLKELRTRDQQALTGLLMDYSVLAESDARARERLENLERSNDTVRKYLNRRSDRKSP